MRIRAAEPTVVATTEQDAGADDSRGFGAAAKQVAEHASALARLELELATLELKRKAGALGLGIALAVAASIFGVFALAFAFAAAAAALALVLPTWAALLVVFGILLLLALVLGLVGMSRIKRGTPPVPEQAIEEAKRTTTVLRSDGA